MKVSITGTPGTGKTTAAIDLRKILRDFKIIHLNDFIKIEKIYDEWDTETDSYLVDVNKLNRTVKKIFYFDNNVVFESHLSHYLDVDLVIVLRTHPKVLMERLKPRGYDSKKIQENAEAEALDVILIESLDLHGDKVREIDTTNIKSEEVAEIIKSIILHDEKGYEPGRIDWSEEFF
ncbi:MAG TPA: AAA family ATPase [Halobacteria archaeon]|jgi:adenylate kinase|nr:AAA family ATPase [Halobacteria archaeon]